MERFRNQDYKTATAKIAGERGLKRKEDQKKQRLNRFNSNRPLDTPGKFDSIPNTPIVPSSTAKSCRSTRKRLTKKELEEKENERYQQMLKWREKRRKIKNLVGKAKKPVFHTGLAQPEKPKFLFTEDKTDGPVHTPLKSAKMFFPNARSTVTKSTVSSAMKTIRTQTPSAKSKLQPKSLKFTSNITPKPGNPTPSSRRLPSAKKSFAPKGFKFEAPKGMPSFDLTKAKTEQKSKMAVKKSTKKASPISKALKATPKSMKNTPKKTTPAGKVDKLLISSRPSISETSKATPKSGKKTPKNTILSGKVDKSQISSPSSIKTPPSISVTTPKSVKKTRENPTPAEKADELQISSPPSAKTPAKQGRGRRPKSNKENVEVSQPLNKSIDSSEPHTPDKVVPRRKSTRKSTKLVTPPTAKLRARTPCSRSTRHSRSVHCNRLSLGSCNPTPKSTKRKTRKSKVTEKPLAEIASPDEDSSAVSRGPLSPVDMNKLANFDTPKLSTRILKRSLSTPELGEELTPGGHKKGPMSSLQRKREAKTTTPLERMFMDLPLDDIPPLLFEDENSVVGMNDTLSNGEVELMSALFEPSKPRSRQASEVGVWGDSGDELETTSPSIKEPWKVITSPVSILKKRKRSAKLNVSFQASGKNKRNSVAYPVTPLPSRRKSRSVKLCEEELPSPSDIADVESRVSLLPGLYGETKKSPLREKVEGDLMSFDTPVTSKSTKRLSRQDSLTLIMETPTATSPSPKVLFDTPATGKKRGRKSKVPVDTPLRRSMRLKGTPKP